MDDYALVIGINDYPNYNRPLRGAISDADEFATWLNDANGGAVKKCEIIRSTPNPLVPLRTHVDEALVRIRDDVVQSDPGRGRRFYFYFSGHGLGVTHTETALCTAQWDDRTWTHAALNLPEYLRMFLESGLFDEIVILADCCRTRLTSTGGRGPDIQWSLRPGTQAGESKAFIAYATQYTNKAFEAAVGGNADDVRGYFTRALLAGLRGAAAEDAGGVTASRLKFYLEDQTPKLAKDGEKSQKAEVQNGLVSTPEPTFGRATPASTLSVTFNARRTAAVLLDGRLQTVFSKPPADPGWKAIQVDAGRLYMLKDLATGDMLPVEITHTGVTDVIF